jgi:triosephosphate isomerase
MKSDTRIPLVAANWKMNKTLTEAREWVQSLRGGIGSLSGVHIVVCPPFPLLFPMAKALDGLPIRLGAQNVHESPNGAFTGEVSVSMLKETGCFYVIIGHSERRHVFGETGPRLAKKVRSVLQAGMVPIYCVGETLEERDAGRTESVLQRQLDDLWAESASPLRVDPESFVIAYEPVWAIGTGRTASTGQAQEAQAFIRRRIARYVGEQAAVGVRILYGGSVKPDNAQSLAEQPDIDGMLVGGASLVADDFLAIIRAVAAAI